MLGLNRFSGRHQGLTASVSKAAIGFPAGSLVRSRLSVFVASILIHDDEKVIAVGLRLLFCWLAQASLLPILFMSANSARF
jgi:hypothetical protein